jgi:hypothetical protein
MMKLNFCFLLASFLGFTIVHAADLYVIKDKNIVDDLNGIIFMTDNYKSDSNIAVKIIRVIGQGECDSSDYDKTCPRQRLLIPTAERSEYGDMAVYRTDGMYDFEFVRWRPDVKKPAGKHGYMPVIFEAKAQRVGPNYKLTDIKYLISVTPWAAQIEEIK